MSYLQAHCNVLWLAASAGWVFRTESGNCTMSRVLLNIIIMGMLPWELFILLEEEHVL